MVSSGPAHRPAYATSSAAALWIAMQQRPSIEPFSPAKTPSPKVAMRAGERPRTSVRYGCAGSSVSVKPSGLFLGLSSGRSGSRMAVSAACAGSGAAFGSRAVVPDPPTPRRASTAFLVPGRGTRAIEAQAADFGQADAGLPERTGRATVRLHQVHEIENVAAVVGDAVGREAVED